MLRASNLQLISNYWKQIYQLQLSILETYSGASGGGFEYPANLLPAGSFYAWASHHLTDFLARNLNIPQNFALFHCQK